MLIFLVQKKEPNTPVRKDSWLIKDLIKKYLRNHHDYNRRKNRVGRLVRKQLFIYHVIKPKVEILIQINYKELRKWIKREWLR